MTTLSQTVRVRTATARYQAGMIAAIESGDTCTVVILGDGAPWEDAAPAYVIARIYAGIAKGTAVGEWQPAAVDEQTEAAITAAIADLATEAYVDAAVAGGLSGYASESYVDAAVAERAAIAGAGSSQVGLGLNAARRPSTTRPTRVSATGQITLTSTLLGAKTATVTLLSDASNPPTTDRGNAKFDLSGVAATVGVPWSLGYDVPAGHYYKLATSGADAAGVSLATINETAG